MEWFTLYKMAHFVSTYKTAVIILVPIDFALVVIIEVLGIMKYMRGLNTYDGELSIIGQVIMVLGVLLGVLAFACLHALF